MIHFDLPALLTPLNTALDGLTFWVYGVSFLLTLTGYYQQVWQRRRDPPRMLEALGFISLAVGVAFSSALWWPMLVNLMYFPAEEMARRGGRLFQVNEAMNRFLDEAGRLVTDTGTGDNGHGQLSKVWNYTWNLGRITRAGIADLVLHGLVSLGTFLAALIALPFYFLQHTLVPVLARLMPVAVCGMTVPVLRGRAVAYFSLTLSVLAWPTGFTLVAFVTNSILAASFVPAGASAAASSLAPSIQTLVAAMVMVIGTLLVPPTFLYLFRQNSAPGPGASAPP